MWDLNDEIIKDKINRAAHKSLYFISHAESCAKSFTSTSTRFMPPSKCC